MNISENSLLTTTTLIANEKASSSQNEEMKRKLPSESLENRSDDVFNHEKLKIQNVEQFLNEAGLNLQLIDKNDKKFVKLNIDKNNFKKLKFINHVNDSCEATKTPTKNNSHLDSKDVKNNVKIQRFSSTIENSEDDIDLPSESDLSNMITIVPAAKRLFNKPISSSSSINSAQIQNMPKSSSMSIFYKCIKCNKLFSNETLLKMHEQSDCLSIKNTCEQTKNSNEEVKFDHAHLNYQIEQTSELNCNSHPAVKSGKSMRKRVQICNECGMQFDTQSNLLKHIQQIHETIGSFECAQCHISFCDQQSKNRHEKESHQKPFRCYICSFEFTRASNLRAHLLKVHPNEIGKLVNISKTVDNKLKFEFDLDAINEYREQIKSLKSSHVSPYPNIQQSNQTLSKQSDSNTLICIKDQITKHSEIEHMVVYVDGIGQSRQSNNPKQKAEENSIFAHLDANNNITKRNASLSEMGSSFYSSKKVTKSNSFSKSSPSTLSNKPVAKIPYLLAAAAAAASSNQRKQQAQQVQAYKNQFISTNKIVSSECARSSCYTLISSNHLNMKSSKDLNKEQEYIQLVSLLKQKNEKLFNPLVDKHF